MHLFTDISSHGLGHLAITAPVLNALADLCPDLRLTVRSGLPESRLRERIHAPFTPLAGSSDFGFVMHDATRINYPASAQAYQRAHEDWHRRVATEADTLAQWAPDLVLTNVSYLPLAAAQQLGIPSASLCSLNWADLFQHFFGQTAWAAPIHAAMLAAYRNADIFFRVTPGMPMPALDNLQPIPPVAALGQRHDLGLPGQRAVLLAMGGIEHRLPVENWPTQPGICWLVPASWQCRHPAARNWESFGLHFTDMLCSVDAVITKPGYGTFTEAACNGTPVLFQRREDWPEQDCLIDWLSRHGRCAEIPTSLLDTGDLERSLAQLWQQPIPARPAANGAHAAAAELCRHLAFSPQLVAGV